MQSVSTSIIVTLAGGLKQQTPISTWLRDGPIWLVHIFLGGSTTASCKWFSKSFSSKKVAWIPNKIWGSISHLVTQWIKFWRPCLPALPRSRGMTRSDSIVAWRSWGPYCKPSSYHMLEHINIVQMQRCSIFAENCLIVWLSCAVRHQYVNAYVIHYL